jgi:hypothetical protein
MSLKDLSINIERLLASGKQKTLFTETESQELEKISKEMEKLYPSTSNIEK